MSKNRAYLDQLELLSPDDVSLISAFTKEDAGGEKRIGRLSDPVYLALVRAYFLLPYQTRFRAEVLEEVLNNRFKPEPFPEYENGLWHICTPVTNTSLPPIEEVGGTTHFPYLAGVVETRVNFDAPQIDHEVRYLFGAIGSQAFDGSNPRFNKVFTTPSELTWFVDTLTGVYQERLGLTHKEAAKALCVDRMTISAVEKQLLAANQARVASSWWVNPDEASCRKFFEDGVPFRFWKFKNPEMSLDDLSPWEKDAVDYLRKRVFNRGR